MDVFSTSPERKTCYGQNDQTCFVHAMNVSASQNGQKYFLANFQKIVLYFSFFLLFHLQKESNSHQFGTT